MVKTKLGRFPTDAKPQSMAAGASGKPDRGVDSAVPASINQTVRYGLHMRDRPDPAEHLSPLSTVKMLWQAVSMATFLGSLLTALIFQGDLPDETAFVWTMGVFGGSILVALPILVLCSVPALALIKALSRRYERFLFPANVIGGLLGAAVIGVLLLLVMATMPGPLPIGSPADRAVLAGKVVLAGFAYGMSLTLFIGLSQRPAVRSREAHPPR